MKMGETFPVALDDLVVPLIGSVVHVTSWGETVTARIISIDENNVAILRVIPKNTKW